MTNIDLDQIIPKDMPEWFEQRPIGLRNALEWCFRLPYTSNFTYSGKVAIRLDCLPFDDPIRYLAGSMMMAYWRERVCNDSSRCDLAELAEIISRGTIKEELIDFDYGNRIEEYSDNYDAAREWRDGKGE